jgi:hypothetical protein
MCQTRRRASGPFWQELTVSLRFSAVSAGLFLFQHADLQRNDALDGPLALGPTGNQVVHERADDLETRFQIDPIDGENVLLALVIDPGRGEASISAERP